MVALEKWSPAQLANDEHDDDDAPPEPACVTGLREMCAHAASTGAERVYVTLYRFTRELAEWALTNGGRRTDYPEHEWPPASGKTQRAFSVIAIEILGVDVSLHGVEQVLPLAPTEAS